MESKTQRVNGVQEMPEIEMMNGAFSKLVGGYSLISKALMVREIAELKERIDKASYEFGLLRDRVSELESRPTMEQVKNMVDSAKTELRGEFTK